MAHCKVFVGSLPAGTKPKELRHLFQNFGIVIECDVMNRCGFIHMESPTMAETAILALHGSDFKGQTIVVEPGRSKDNNTQRNIGTLQPLMNMLCAPVEQSEDRDHMAFIDASQGGRRGRGGFGSHRGMGSRGGMPSRGGMGYSPGISNRGGMNMQGGMGPQGFGRGSGMGGRGSGMGGRGSGMGGRGGVGGMGGRGGGGMGGNTFTGSIREDGGFSGNTRGSFRGRGGMNGGRDAGGDSRIQNDSGPIRHSPIYKTRSGPYPSMGGGGGPPYETTRGRGSQRGGPRGRGVLGGSNRTSSRFSDINPQSQHENMWSSNKNDGQGGPSANADFEDRSFYQSNVGSHRGNFRGKSNFMQHNAGQDRRGFTLADSPHHLEHNSYGNHRPLLERQNSFRGDDMQMDSPGYPQRFNMRGGGPNQIRGRGGRGNFSGRGGGRGGYGGFNTSDAQMNKYNQEFPALAPVRGRGGFRGGFNRNAPNMMPNHR